MFTRENFNEQAMTCELGGELVDSNHDDLIGLCRAFNIPVDSFAAGDQGLAPNLYYFAGRLHTDQDVIAHFRAVSRALARDAQACAVPENQADDPYYFTAAAKHLDHTSLEHYLGRIQGIEKWVIDMIRVAYVGEFGLEASEQSALGLVLTLSPDTTQGFKLFGESDQSQRIRGGNIALIRALEADLNRRGVPIHLEHPLVSIREMSSRLELVFGGNTPSRTMSADEVVCTIPFTLLREVEGIKTLPISELKRECIRELGYGTNSKRMLGFTERSWRHGFQSPTHRIPSSNGSVYTDLSVQNLWETSRTQTGRSGILTVFLGGQSGANLNVSHPNAHLVEIDRIFPGTRRLHDSHHAALNWSHFPWTQGSYACARLGQTTRFGGIAYQPELAGRLLFAGEHATAQFSGFMNGACSSGRVAAQTIISRRHSAAA